MKNLIIFLITLLIYNLGIAQIVDIPDSNFKFTLVNFPCVDTNNDGFGDSDADTNDDGEIQVTEAEAVLGLYFANQGINLLEGIQSFINLKGFGFAGDDIMNIDLTQNTQLESLRFGSVLIATLDLSQNINLIELKFGDTQITDLNLTNNTQLLFLECNNSPITTIDLSQNINLKDLSCTYTPLTEINLSQNINLEKVLVRFNELTSLDISNLPNLKEIGFNLNQVSVLDTSNNPNLETLIADNNLITSLDLSNNPNLVRVTISNNGLTSLNLKNGNTNSIFKMWAHDNPNLSCIQVDDVTYPETQICTSSNGWCKDDTAIYSEECVLGITGQSLQEAIQLYPNPVKDVLQIKIQNGIVAKRVQVYDVMGKQVLQSKTISQIDFSTIAAGLLFVKIETDMGIITKKVIKE